MLDYLRKSLICKIFAAAFVGTHIPLIVLIGYFAAGFPFEPAPTLILILMATLGGTGLSLFVLWRLIKPLRALAAAVKRYDADGTLVSLPTRRSDEIGQLSAAISAMVAKVDGMTKQLRHEAMTDPLTGLRNRRWLMERFPIEQARARRVEEPMSVILFDLDHFKRVNDTHGHGVGDKVLMGVGEILADCLRPYDLAARIGGEEFCVVMPRTSGVKAAAIAQRLRTAFEAMDVEPLNPGEITCSFGVSETKPHEPLSQIMNRTDQALYKAKAHGRNRVMRAVGDDRFEILPR